MEQRWYSKNEIVELVAVQLREEIIGHSKRYKDDIGLLKELEVQDEDKDVFAKFEKRFTNVANFLLKTDVRKLLGDTRGYDKSKQYFFSKQMTITRSADLKGENNAYQLNLIDVLFMTSLMLTYNHPSFTALRRSKSPILNPETLMNDWETAFGRSLSILCDLLKQDIEEEANLPSAEVIHINLMSLFWQLSPLVEMYNQGIYKDLAVIAAVFQALPEEKRADFYTKRLATPLKKIKNNLLDLINIMEADEDKSDYNQLNYNYDLEYDPYEFLSQLPNGSSMSDLSNLLKIDHYDIENEPNKDKEK